MAAITQVGALSDVSLGALRKTVAGLTGAHLEGSLPFTAQHAPTNEPLHMARTFATLSLPLEEMHEVGRHFGATLNDVAATIVDAGLHRYLRETGRAFAHRFNAFIPVSLRADGDTAIGTRVSAMFVPLGEPAAPAPERLRQVVASIASGKQELRAMSKDAAMTYAVGIVGLAGLAASTHLDRVGHPAANLVISNVPGAKETSLSQRRASRRHLPDLRARGLDRAERHPDVLPRPHGLRLHRQRGAALRPAATRAPHARGLRGTEGGRRQIAGSAHNFRLRTRHSVPIWPHSRATSSCGSSASRSSDSRTRKQTP